MPGFAVAMAGSSSLIHEMCAMIGVGCRLNDMGDLFLHYAEGVVRDNLFRSDVGIFELNTAKTYGPGNYFQVSPQGLSTKSNWDRSFGPGAPLLPRIGQTTGMGRGQFFLDENGAVKQFGA